MGSTEAKAYLASPEVVAASSLTGKISGSGRYRQPDDWTGIEFGVSKVVGQLDSMQASAETEFGNKIKGSAEDSESEISVLPGFPEKISGEVSFQGLGCKWLKRHRSSI